MCNGEANQTEILEVMLDQTSKLEGSLEVLSVFSGRVFWETLDGFKGNHDEEHDLSRLLEVRVYGASGEFHAQRSSIDVAAPLRWRVVLDSDKQAEIDYFDDVQKLDIDMKRSSMLPEGIVCSTGGGEYELPDSQATRIRLRNYLAYDADGMARIVDYRIVSLERSLSKAGE